mgnify:CR=1 FL=1
MNTASTGNTSTSTLTPGGGMAAVTGDGDVMMGTAALTDKVIP